MLQKPECIIYMGSSSSSRTLCPDGSAGLQVYTRKTQDEEADALGSGFDECLVGTGGCLISILIAKRLNTDRQPLERWKCENKIKLAVKQRSIRWKAATSTATGKQTKPLPLALLRGRAGPPLPMWSQHKQARTKDFKAATHKRHTQGLSETSPVMWLKARCTQTGSLAKQRGRCPCQFWSAANQRLCLLWGGHFGGSGHLPDWLSTCCSPICPPAPHSVTTGLSFTLPQGPPLPLYLPLPGGTKHMPAVS